MSSRLAAISLSICALVAVTACGGDDSSSDTSSADPTEAPASPTEAPAGDAAIVMANFAFTVTSASPGSITVRNDDTAAHTATADDGAFDVKVDSGATATIEVDAAGTYAFHCTIHPSMTAELVVA